MINCDITFIWDFDLSRQTPNGLNICGDVFFSQNKLLEPTDFWVVFDNLPGEQCRQINPDNTILVTGEPRSVTHYPQKYLDQFAVVVTPRSDLRHSGKIVKGGVHPWFTGRSVVGNSAEYTSNYDSLSDSSPQKTKLISAITSDKTFTEGHASRLDFIQSLSTQLNFDLDLFGRGINEINDKGLALEKYKYHIVIENSSEQDYWTEKLADAYLNECHPIYYGCSNIHDYFDQKAITLIDINKPHDAIKKIRETIEEDLYSKSIAAVKNAKSRCLNELNMMNQLAEIVGSLNCNSNNKQTVTLRPMNYFT